ncbi:metallo-beta-lactamase domain-containing protein 2 isoform X2 [Eurytemora carolleeae]|uniref:metallo-beta-lactamase domain-containing protein 2 isoform X2 n=1 Tax=Eurytemora carolleeae TaxID=1294199 RepID=UPI000C758FBC|nr:metallo-beta-lactamase domain-containing protein 2 isoform X2 [Eurytemora carolleeae]|eukprot:XP_023322516.1 metallo-beta-lactamase domain-containing protein 2-like isoform X2 [Eurytemora affinis]
MTLLKPSLKIFSCVNRFSSSVSNKIHPLYKHTQVSENVFLIQEKYFISWNLANIFFIRGSDRDLLVDTGVGIFNLPAYLTSAQLRNAPDKPLDVVLTHAHFDHSGGAHQFSKVFIHKLEDETVKTGNRRMTASWVTREEVVPKPTGTWNHLEYRVLPSKVFPIENNFEFDLGDRTFKVLHIPGHSPGSIALIDEIGVLITGDTLYKTSHGLIDWYPGSSCYRMRSSVEKLVNLCRQHKVETILPGHNQGSGTSRVYWPPPPPPPLPTDVFKLKTVVNSEGIYSISISKGICELSRWRSQKLI